MNYGDPTGIMGNMWFGNWDERDYFFIAPHKYQLGWFHEQSIFEVKENGRYMYVLLINF